MDENYARKAVKWYGLMLEAPDLVPRFEAGLLAQKSSAERRPTGR